MKLFLFLVLFNLSFNSLSQQNLKYFDRKMIVKYKIKSIWEGVYTELRTDKEGQPCPNVYYTFDMRGNILTYGLGRVGTIYGFKYNDKNEMVDFYWKNRSSGEIEMSYSEKYGNDSAKIKEELKSSDSRFKEMLGFKKSYENDWSYGVSDVCAWINAEYKITVVKESNDLPSVLEGKFIKEFDEFQSPKKPMSPDQIYIYYDYEFFK
jgi:hypothetical protein